jgi:hypothetical protein
LGGERGGAADRRQLERVAKLLARLRAAVGSAKCRSQLGARLRVLELRRRVRQHLDRFPKEREPLLATFDQSRRAQGCAERPRGTRGTCEPELFARQPAGFVLLAKLEQGEGGRRAPGDEGGIPGADRLEAATGVEHLPEAADQIAVQQTQARADVGEIEQARIIFGEGWPMPVRASAAAASSSLPCSISGLVVGDARDADHHAHRVVALERSLRLFLEASVQHGARALPGLTSLLGAAYLTLHLAVPRRVPPSQGGALLG